MVTDSPEEDNTGSKINARAANLAKVMTKQLDTKA